MLQRKGNRKQVLMSWLFLGLLVGLLQSNIFIAIQGATYSSSTNILPEQDFNYSFQEIGQYSDRYGAPSDIAVKDNLAFVACYWGGLLIFNISNPYNPTLISNFFDDCVITGPDACMNEGAKLAIQDDLVLFAHAHRGLLFINVSNPTNPFLQGRYDRYLYNVEVQNNLAFLLCPGIRHINYGDVIQIVDFSDVTNPALIGELDYSLTGGYIWDMCVFNDFIYGISGENLIVINTTNPTQPQEISRLDINGADIIAVLDENHIIAGNSTSIKIVNVDTPSAPLLLEELQLPISDITSIYATNGTVYLADYNKSKIVALNVTDIENVTQIGEVNSYASTGYSWKTLAYSLTKNATELLICADYRFGLFCFDVTNKSQMKFEGYFDTNCMAKAVTIEGDYAYVCSRREWPYYPSRLEIITVTNITKPTLVGKYDFSVDTVMDVEVSNGYAFLSLAAGGLVILDVKNPAHPVKVGIYSHNATIGYFYNLKYDNESQRCYLTHSYYGLFILDCSDPMQPTLLTTIVPSQPFILRNVFVQGNIVYLTAYEDLGALAIYDLSNLLQPVLLSRIYTGEPISDIQVEGSLIYLTTTYEALRIVDASILTAPVFLSEVKNWWFQTQGLVVNGSYAFIAQYAAGLRAIDISNPEKPKEIAAIRDHYRGVCYDVKVHGSYIFIADGWDGLEIYQLVKEPRNITTILLATIIPGLGLGMMVTIIILSRKRK